MNQADIPTDIRDETCTNLTILLKLFIRKIQPGEVLQVIGTKKQLIQIEDIVSGFGISVSHEVLPEDLLISLGKK
jgi:TusA-related sulfurtransferase